MQTRVPPDTPIADREKLSGEKQRWAIFNVWPDLPQPALAGNTPREIAKKDRESRSLQAAVLVLETSHATAGEIIDFNRLREELQLPLPQPISPEGTDPDRIPMVRMHRVTVDAMSDEWLLHAYRRAAMLAATSVLAQLAPEVINRESMGGTVDKAEACGLLAGGSPTSEQAIEWLTKARNGRLEKKSRRPAGCWPNWIYGFGGAKLPKPRDCYKKSKPITCGNRALRKHFMNYLHGMALLIHVRQTPPTCHLRLSPKLGMSRAPLQTRQQVANKKSGHPTVLHPVNKRNQPSGHPMTDPAFCQIAPRAKRRVLRFARIHP